MKFQKQHSKRESVKTKSTSGYCFGYFALYVEESGKINSKQLGAIWLILKRALKKQAKTWFRVFVHKSLTKKPNETRLGKGKGGVKYWNAIVRKGKILIELKSCNEKIALQSLIRAQKKISINTSIRSRFNRWIL